MPLLRRLLRPEQLGDAPAAATATAEQLFASSIYSQELRAQRQQAAALCSAPLIAMSTLQNDTRSMLLHSVLGNMLEQAATCSVEQCVAAALMVATDGGRVLFLVRDPKLVTKRLAAAVSSSDAAVSTDLAAECLHRVRFRQCRGVYELLCELDRVEHGGQDGAGVQLVALGPLCDLFAGFQTASGITTTGAGLKRMVELAIKRLRATTGIHVIVMEAGES